MIAHELLADSQVIFDPASPPFFKVAGLKPLQHFLPLPKEKGEFFLESREAGIINIGGRGLVGADGVIYEMDALDCVYLGKGTTDVKFFSEDESDPALFIMISVAASFSYPNHLVTKQEATPIETQESGNGSVLVYIRPGGIQSCQLQMGIGIGAEPKILSTPGILEPTAPFICYHFNGVLPSFIWAATSCD